MSKKTPKQLLEDKTKKFFDDLIKSFKIKSKREKIIDKFKSNDKLRHLQPSIIDNIKTDFNLITKITHAFEYDRTNFLSFPLKSDLRVQTPKNITTEFEAGCFILGEKMKEKYGDISKNYSILRDNFINDFFRNQKTPRCPACGQILETKSKNSVPNTDLDHFFPKEKYPQFSLTVDNFIPTCLECNMREKGSDFPFNAPSEINQVINSLKIIFPEKFRLYDKLEYNSKYWNDSDTTNSKIFSYTDTELEHKLLSIYGLDKRHKVIADHCVGTLLQYIKYSYVKDPYSLEHFIHFLSYANYEEKNDGYPLHQHPDIWEQFLNWVLDSDDNLLSVWEEVKDYTTTMSL
jgi:hypothetical protein